jgi:hypothetical protein
MNNNNKRGLMNRFRRGATWSLTALTLLALGGVAHAQQIFGRVTGRVVDQDNGTPLGGVTVIVQGPQGEEATITDDKGHYIFTSLGVGTYTIRFYVANAATQVEQPGVTVSAEKTVRVNAKIPSTAQAAAQQTYVITGKAPTVDVGSSRVATSFDQEFTQNLALNPDYGSVITRAPGVFVDGSGNASIGGATGLENQYIVNGLNVTGLRFGNLEAGQSSLAGGTNLPTEFLQQIDVNSGGYSAEFGGALGGVINTVLKSGTNEFHGRVWTSWAPYWLSADPKVVTQLGSSIAGVRRPDFDTRIGFEVGGPLIKDKLFFWAGFAPQINGTHVQRLVYAQDGMGGQTFLPWATRRLDETRQTYAYGASIDYIVSPEHKLTVSAVGTPSFNKQLRSFGNGQELNSEFPSNGNTTWPLEQLTKTNSDVIAHWTSQLNDRRWTIEALAGLHNEYFYNRSPDNRLNNLNQIQYWYTDLGSREGIPGCENGACPAGPLYTTGGFGQVSRSVGNRWSGELKSSHIFEGGGRHELKYGYALNYSTFALSRYYSGPWYGGNGLSFINGDGTISSQNFFRLGQDQYPVDFGSRYPYSDLVQKPLYQDFIHASVKSVSQALFLQDSFSPAPLRNLTISAGARLELQKIYDMNGTSFLDASNLGPRIGAVYDPFNDGRSKISAGYGRYYEAVPLDIAARYFGGENFVARNNVPATACANQDPGTWTGAGEWQQCGIPARGDTMATDPAAFYQATYNTALKQSHIKGQFQNEIVATAERQVMDDMTVRLDYTHRWLGTIIEDGYGDPTFQTVLANPGNVPSEAINDARNELNVARENAAAADMRAKAAADAMSPDAQILADKAAVANSQAATAQTKYDSLQTFATAPKPSRTYDAITASVNKRFGKNWFGRAAYTYSRLVGNYQGLFQAEQNYFAPNGSNSYDVPDLYVNNYGRLPNDRPHQFKADGFYSLPVGKGKVTLGLSFTARSGVPRGYNANLIPGGNYQLVQLLPRGSGGRTPMVTQFDAHIAYGMPLTKTTNIEAFIDLFNFLNQRETLLTDDNYTYQTAAPIENGTKKDLAFAKDISGAPIQQQPNYGRPVAYQLPFYSRLGLRLTF